MVGWTFTEGVTFNSKAFFTGVDVTTGQSPRYCNILEFSTITVQVVLGLDSSFNQGESLVYRHFNMGLRVFTADRSLQIHTGTFRTNSVNMGGK